MSHNEWRKFFENQPRVKANYTIRYQLQRNQIMEFVSALHETQWELIEATVASREKQGFPEATTVIKHIMNLK